MPITRRQFAFSLLGLGAAPALHAAEPALLLAQVAAPDVDPAPYLVSEKYDGVRAWWDGRALRFRSGRPVPAPAWFTASLPGGFALDGELWLGRGRFDLLSGTVRKAEPVDAEWRALRYMVFEAPGVDGPFSRRHERLKDVLAALGQPQMIAAPQARIADRAALQRRLDEVVRGGGEGLVLHRADAPYLTGRSEALLKLKPLHDTEAVVVGWQPGRGKYEGMLGALELRTPEGLRFRLGTGFSDEQRRNPPPIGSTVTYSYRELTPSGVPRFASFVAMRDGL